MAMVLRTKPIPKHKNGKSDAVRIIDFIHVFPERKETSHNQKMKGVQEKMVRADSSTGHQQYLIQFSVLEFLKIGSQFDSWIDILYKIDSQLGCIQSLIKLVFFYNFIFQRFES